MRVSPREYIFTCALVLINFINRLENSRQLTVFAFAFFLWLPVVFTVPNFFYFNNEIFKFDNHIYICNQKIIKEI
jgi:hypothetical protein